MALADIEDRHYITGFSPSLRARQRIDSRCLVNLYAFALAFYLRFGYPLIITEGARTRVRQKYLRQLYEAYLRGGPWAALAAILYTSRHDEVNNPNAIDFGSGIASSQTSASKWAHENGPKYGISFTIHTEPWHGEISYTATAPAGSAGGTPIGDEDLDANQNLLLTQAAERAGWANTNADGAKVIATQSRDFAKDANLNADAARVSSADAARDSAKALEVATWANLNADAARVASQAVVAKLDQVLALPAAPGGGSAPVDYDLLATKVADKLAARLAS